MSNKPAFSFDDDDPVTNADVDGKTIKTANFGKDAYGYPLFVIEFTDGTFLAVEEIGQTGSITVYGGV